MVNETYFEEWPRLQDGRLNCSICENKLCLGEEDYDVYQSYISVDKFETVLICLIALVFICGIIGNALVFIAVTTTKSMQSVTNIFIVNLAMADMLVMIFCVPPTVIWDVTNTWIFGSLMCRIVLYIQDISVSVSVLTLTFIAYDRYYAICRPLQFSSRKTKAAVVIAAIWTISAIIGIPNAISLEAVTPFDDEEQFPCLARDEIFFDLSSCKPKWGENVDFTITLLKAVFVIIFTINSFPVHCLPIAQYILRKQNPTVYERINWFIIQAGIFTHCMFYLNSAINPIIYYFMSAQFKAQYRRILSCRCTGDSSSPIGHSNRTYLNNGNAVLRHVTGGDYNIRRPRTSVQGHGSVHDKNRLGVGLHN
ncbi:HCRTR2 [Lepeophtheirus salmonis]|uniref:HCRTR2 n=1 Tax=Lepeophtheirus salmonis TaxID=72036 RepID=A0A7R8CZ62_LEPSM|nr:HCRTR2 [Lepeophtheirus salmonis]CAF2973966.1 HCRTR2 [Lepeophtheirus salmonis]